MKTRDDETIEKLVDDVTSKAAPKEAKSDDDEDEGMEAKADDADDDDDENGDDDADETADEAKPKKESRSWFKFVVSQTDGDTTPVAPQILVYDEIGGWGKTAMDFQRELKSLGNVSAIDMRINSPGGDSFQGIAIHNMLAAHPAKITCHIDGIAASAASLIAMAADKIVAPKNAFMVIHNPSAMTVGDAKTHRAMADDLDRVTESYAQTYADRSGQDLGKVKSLMDEDRLMGAQEAEDLGYIDDCTAAKAMAATFALEKIPERFKAAASIFEKPKQEPEAPKVEAKVAPVPEVKEEPKASYGQAEIDATLELCTIANAPVSLATKFIGAKTPIDDVRKALLAHRASKNSEAIISDAPIVEKQERDPRMADPDIVANKRKLNESLKKEMGIRPRS